MWNILHTTKETAKTLAGSILTTKALRLQKEYMYIQKTRITLHGVPMYITEEHFGTFFSDYGPVEEVFSINVSRSLPTSDFENGDIDPTHF